MVRFPVENDRTNSISTSRVKEAAKAYDTKFFMSLFERAFKMMKNGVCFIRIALLVAELFKILIYANYITCDVTL